MKCVVCIILCVALVSEAKNLYSAMQSTNFNIESYLGNFTKRLGLLVADSFN